MQVVEAGEFSALCEADGRHAQVDLMLVGRQEPGTWLLVFLGAAREVLAEDDAQKIRAAHAVLQDVLNGSATSVEHHFSDLVARSPQLPDFLNPGSKSQ